MSDGIRPGDRPEGRRFLPLAGARNVRDLGGYPAADGRRVKWGRLFRGGDLNELTGPDLDLLSGLSIKTFIDFRRRSEILVAPDRRPSSVRREITLPIDPGDFSVMTAGPDRPGGRLMEDLNRLLARDFQEPFGRFLALLARPENQPALFHCAAGKDRTGFAAMLILAALGVERENLAADYLLSNQGLGDKYAGQVEKNPYLEPVMVADVSYLEAALTVIDQEYGGLPRYLTGPLRADLPKLRELYLE